MYIFIKKKSVQLEMFFVVNRGQLQMFVMHDSIREANDQK